MTPVAPGLTDLLAAALVFYTAVLFAISWWARGRIHDSADYLVAGRRLPFSISTAKRRSSPQSSVRRVATLRSRIGRSAEPRS